MTRLLIALGAAFATLAPRAAEAQQSTFYLDRIQISGAPDDGVVVWRPYVAEKTRFYAATALGYTLNPLRDSAVTTIPNVQQVIGNPVSNQMIWYLNAGAEIVGRVTVGVSLPIILFQTGGTDPQAEKIGSGLSRRDFVGEDLRFNVKVKVYQSDNRKLQLGVGGAFWVPTGSYIDFASDGQATAYVYGAGEYDFGALQIAGTLGPQFRPDNSITGAGTGTPLDVTSELRWTAGVFFPMRQGQLRLAADLWGSTGIGTGDASGKSTFFSERNTDLEWMGELRANLSKTANLYFNGAFGTRLSNGYGAPDVRILAMVGGSGPLFDTNPRQVARRERSVPDVEMHDKDTDGDGYPDDIDDCPTEKEDGKPPNPHDGCPGPKDRDGDGIPDDRDKCPDNPEDKDGIQDDDGCPETDADSDGVLDVDDACPLVPGEKNKDPKKNGCKEHKKILEEKGEIKLLEPIQFDFGKSTIKPESDSILDEVVDVLKSRPDVRMGVYGHTDNHGSRALNTQLSKDRARSVVNYLVGKGIAKNRLESDGFGPDKPIEPNDTDAGRAKNRRVEFKILGE
jgi:outer membrane protein OmpA-like peptidoglycan-associated protein